MKAFGRNILILFSLILFVFIARGYQNNALSLHFVDEEEYIVLGSYILNGDKLYQDIFTNHQPLTYLLSSGVQKLTSPNTIFLLIKRHREAIILWSFFWLSIIFLRFGKQFLPAMFLFELSKIYLLGNLFLAESLIVYPLVYLVLLVVGRKIINLKEKVIVGILSGFVTFLLAPLWPLVFALITLLLINQGKDYFKNTGKISIGFLLVILFITPFISWQEYFQDSIYTNIKYFLPIASHDPFYISLLKSYLAPFLSFLPEPYPSVTIWIERFASLILIVNLAVFIKKRQFYLPVIIFIILGLSNIRFIQPGLQHYQGFHLLPWFATLLILAGYTTYLLWKTIFKSKAMILPVFIWVCLFAVTLYFAKETLFAKRDLTNEWFINYSTQFSIGEAVRIMKSSSDKLFVAPDEWLVYWQAHISHANKAPGFYAWMYNVPYLNIPVHQMFQIDPPTFFYANNRDVSLKIYFGKYVEMKKDGSKTGLFVLPDKINSLREDQKSQLIYLGFNIGQK